MFKSFTIFLHSLLYKVRIPFPLLSKLRKLLKNIKKLWKNLIKCERKESFCEEKLKNEKLIVKLNWNEKHGKYEFLQYIILFTCWYSHTISKKYITNRSWLYCEKLWKNRNNIHKKIWQEYFRSYATVILSAKAFQKFYKFIGS